MTKKRKRSDRMASIGLPNPIDIHVGQRVRERRTMLGMSQTALGEHLGITFQQIQKYENGTNRVSSSRLFDLCRVLKVPMTYFFENMSRDTESQSPGALRGKAPAIVDREADPLTKRETLELVRAYFGIEDSHIRQLFRNLVRAVAEGKEDLLD